MRKLKYISIFKCLVEKSLKSLNSDNRKLWFSLIELLVIAAIIAILLAMLLPALKRSKEASKRSLCQNNTRQLGFSVMNFLTDKDGYMYGKATTGDNGIYLRWITTDTKGGKYIDVGTDNFLDSNRPGGTVLDCPSQDNIGDYTFDRYPGASGLDLYYVDINIFTTGMKKTPAREAMLMDAYCTMLRFGSWKVSHAVHNGGQNVNFYDLHSEWIPANTIAAYTQTDPFWYRYE